MIAHLFKLGTVAEWMERSVCNEDSAGPRLRDSPFGDTEDRPTTNINDTLGHLLLFLLFFLVCYRFLFLLIFLSFLRLLTLPLLPILPLLFLPPASSPPPALRSALPIPLHLIRVLLYHQMCATKVMCSAILQIFWNAGCQLVALNFQTLGEYNYELERTE